MTAINQRILSLDVFRGITIVLMILVNSQLSSLGYPILLHADWNGCTLADLVFPSFLFIVGLTSVISLSKQRVKTTSAAMTYEIIKRSVILFLLGLFLNIFPVYVHLPTLRIYGILQRIAFCYLICSLICLHTTVKTQVIIFVTLLIGYWLIMTQIPVPGFGINQLTAEGSWVAYVDQMLFSSAHLLEKTFDPEGFLSTFPSIATTLFGVLIGHLILNPNVTKEKKLFWMVIVGIISLFLGGLWNMFFPINKNLWTSSYVLWTGGISLLAFSSCFALIDVLGYKRWSVPFKIFGMNALFAFIFHVLLIKIQLIFKVKTQSGSLVNLKTVITNALFYQFNPANAVLLYSLFFIFLNFLVVLFLYKRKIFIRI